MSNEQDELVWIESWRPTTWEELTANKKFFDVVAKWTEWSGARGCTLPNQSEEQKELMLLLAREIELAIFSARNIPYPKSVKVRRKNYVNAVSCCENLLDILNQNPVDDAFFQGRAKRIRDVPVSSPSGIGLGALPGRSMVEEVVKDDIDILSRIKEDIQRYLRDFDEKLPDLLRVQRNKREFQNMLLIAYVRHIWDDVRQLNVMRGGELIFDADFTNFYEDIRLLAGHPKGSVSELKRLLGKYRKSVSPQKSVA
jgi:hypothetical protein